MGALEELIHYCNEKDPIGAMLLTGEWGCGKTYLIESELTKALEHTHIIVKVSLFGITDAGTLRSTIRQKWFEACTPILGQLRKAKEKSGGFLAALNTALHAINPLAGDAANVMVSMNMLDVVPIKAEVEDPKIMEKKRVVLVYDDLEDTLQYLVSCDVDVIGTDNPTMVKSALSRLDYSGGIPRAFHILMNTIAGMEK